MSRILVHDPSSLADDLEAPLAVLDHEVVTCHDRSALVRAFSECCPSVLVYVLQELARDVELLSAIRTCAPRLPIILLGEPATLESRRLIQNLRPTYYGVFPLEGTELADAVDGTLGSGSGAHRANRAHRS